MKDNTNQSPHGPSLDIEANLCLLIIGCEKDTGESIYKVKYHEAHKRRNEKYIKFYKYNKYFKFVK